MQLGLYRNNIYVKLNGEFTNYTVELEYNNSGVPIRIVLYKNYGTEVIDIVEWNKRITLKQFNLIVDNFMFKLETGYYNEQ